VIDKLWQVVLILAVTLWAIVIYLNTCKPVECNSKSSTALLGEKNHQKDNKVKIINAIEIKETKSDDNLALNINKDQSGDFLEQEPKFALEQKNEDSDLRHNKAIIAVEEFYVSVRNKDCKRAKEIRPKYEINQCKLVSTAGEPSLSLVQYRESSAVVSIIVSIEKNHSDGSLHNSQFDGFIFLEKLDGNWLIREPLASKNKLSKEKFVERYFKGEGLIPKSMKKEIEDVAEANSLPEEPSERIEPVTALSPPIQKIGLLSYSSFGSSNILSNWSPKELFGNPLKDKKVQRHLPADHSSPDHNEPQVTGNPLPANYRNSIRYVPDPKKKIIALTFDLCERATEITGYDGAIVNYLRKNGVKATFYAGGKWMRSHPNKTQQLMADPLFEIGNHGWTHGNMRVLKGDRMKNQILWTQAQYEILRGNLQEQFNISNEEMNKIPPVPLTFRFPYGTCSTESLDTLADMGLPAVQWNIVTADPVRGQTGKAISQTILKKARPGSIIIAHANGRGHGTADSLNLFIGKLRNQGYKFVTISELLASSKRVKSTTECYELRSGDNKRYDRIFGEGTE